MMKWEDTLTLSEIIKNTAEALAIFGGAFALIKWFSERHDRSTDVLFKLEEAFNSAGIREAQKLIEDESKFNTIRKLLVEQAIPDPEQGAEVKANDPQSEELKRRIAELDNLLRFYIFLLGVKKAKQVPDSALASCYRYFLCHYYSRNRRELRIYIDAFWPTLKRWLAYDAVWWKRRTLKRFFDPEFFNFTCGIKPKDEDLVRKLKGKVLVVTGSGISAESGIPTFRGPGGYWRNYDAKKLGTRKAFQQDPELVWKFYLERRDKIAKAESNPAHRIVADIAKHAREFLLITQNVDDLHERGGLLPDSQIVHIHGRININRCDQCGYSDENRISPEKLPECPNCKAWLRPGVVWFDEELDPQEEQRIEGFLREGNCDLVLAIGTTAIFSYIVNWCLRASSGEAVLIEINPEETKLSAAADEVIRTKAVTALRQRIEPLLQLNPHQLNQ